PGRHADSRQRRGPRTSPRSRQGSRLRPRRDAHQLRPAARRDTPCGAGRRRTRGMKLPYLPARVSRPRATLGGGQVRHRPVGPFRVIGPRSFLVRDGLLDTGADETVVGDWMAGYLGIDLTQAPEEPVNLVGRPGTIACRYATVELLISDVRETYRW